MHENDMRHVGPCVYEGSFKAVDPDGHASILMCKSHVDTWIKFFPKSIVVKPRKVFPEETYICKATWPIPGAVP